VTLLLLVLYLSLWLAVLWLCVLVLLQREVCLALQVKLPPLAEWLLGLPYWSWFNKYWYVLVLALLGSAPVVGLVTFWVRHRIRRQPWHWVWGLVVIVPPLLVLAVLGQALAQSIRAAHRGVAEQASSPPPVPDQAREFVEILRQVQLRARDDERPAGIRLVRSDAAAHLVDRMQTIVVPEPFAQGQIVGSRGSALILGRKPAGAFRFAGVEPGDYLELKPGGQIYRIRQVLAPDRLELGEAQAPTALPQDVPAPPESDAPPNYQILRQARPGPGSQPLALPGFWVLDQTPGPPRGEGLSTPGVRDILFAPTGQVMHLGPEVAVIRLWLREPGAVVPGRPEALVEVWPRTGLVVSYPVNRNPQVGDGDPYYYARQGKDGGAP
jgi:hypothetical protein